MEADAPGDRDGLYHWSGSTPQCQVGSLWSCTWTAPFLVLWVLTSFSIRPTNAYEGRVCLPHGEKLDRALKFSVLLVQVLPSDCIPSAESASEYSPYLLQRLGTDNFWNRDSGSCTTQNLCQDCLVAAGSAATLSFFSPCPALVSSFPPHLHLAPVLKSSAGLTPGSAWLTVSRSLTFWYRHPWAHH